MRRETLEYITTVIALIAITVLSECGIMLYIVERW